jgi:hypothetical protein
MTIREKRKKIREIMGEIEQANKKSDSFEKTFELITLVAKLVQFLMTSYKPPKKGSIVFECGPNLKTP